MNRDRVRGRKVSGEQVERVVIQTRRARHRGLTFWSTRELARTTGLIRMTISRSWRLRITTHRQRYRQVSPDPLLIEKVRDIAGCISTLREHSPVLGVVETSQSCDGRARYNTLMMWFCK